jgi:hypothetical protein
LAVEVREFEIGALVERGGRVACLHTWPSGHVGYYVAEDVQTH